MSRQRWSLAVPLVAIVVIAGGFGLGISAQGGGQGPPAGLIPPGLRDRIQSDGDARVIVELRLPSAFVPEGQLANRGAIVSQRQSIANARGRVVSSLAQGGARLLRQYETVPFVVLELPAAALARLDAASGDIVRVFEDALLQPSLVSSVPLIQGDQAWQSGYDGAGTAIAVLDSGVDASHPFFGGRVAAEACFSSTVKRKAVSMCPNGQETQVGAGSAAPCDWNTGCDHGTHVTGIAAGNGAPIGQPFSGVARNASIMAVQVFSKVTSSKECGGVAPCLGAFTSDVIAGLEHVYATVVDGQLDVVAVNMSLGGGQFAAPCDAEPYKPAIDNLRSIGVASVVASGNSYLVSELSSPACISSAVSVASTSLADEVSLFSNVAPFLSLLAPGDVITSSIKGGGYEALSGTSMAAPHVSGAWALIRQAAPGADVDDVLDALQSTGLPVTDTRFWGPGTTTVPRVRILQALAELAPVTSPAPLINDVSPDTGRAGLDLALIVTGSGFNALSRVRWNGVDVPTTTASVQELRAAVPGASVALGTAEVTVFNPAPGGGTSAPVEVVILPPATLTVSNGQVAPGSEVTVTLEHGYGGALDWFSLAGVGAPDTSFVAWNYVGGGQLTATWTVAMPTTPGEYEFRLFLDNGFVRVATSPPVTVDSAVSPAPSVTTLNPATAHVGAPDLTLTVNGTGFVSSSIVRANGSDRTTEYVSSTELRAVIPATDLAVAGTISITVFTPSPGGGTSAPVLLPVVVPPVLAVSATQVSPGGSVTVTLTNGPGTPLDWMTLAAVGAPETTYLAWTWAGSTTTWTVTMPTAEGQYEFRFYPTNGFVRTATSPTVTVAAAPPPPPPPGGDPVLTVSATSVTAGASVTVTLADGPGNQLDWLALAAVGSPDTSYVERTYVGAGVTDRTWTVTMPSTAGTYEFRLFLNDGFTRAATSPPVTVEPPVTSPVLTVSATQVSPGASVTVTLTNGPGTPLDWMALAAVGAPATSYLSWTWAGPTTTWTVTMPTAEGQYEFRFFPSNGFVITATSPTVTVAAAPPPPPPPGGDPVLTVSATSVTAGASVTVTLADGPGNQLDWLALAAVGSPDTSYVERTYVGAGVTDRTWTVTMPSAEGTYEFRLFLNDGFTRAATSPPVTVEPAPTSPVLTVSATQVSPGASVTVTLTNGPGTPLDWLALAAVGAPETSYLSWAWAGSTTTWTVTMPMVEGQYEFRFFPNNGFVITATSPTVTVVAPPSGRSP